MFSILPEDILQEINAARTKTSESPFLAIKHADLKAAENGMSWRSDTAKRRWIITGSMGGHCAMVCTSIFVEFHGCLDL